MLSTMVVLCVRRGEVALPTVLFITNTLWPCLQSAQLALFLFVFFFKDKLSEMLSWFLCFLGYR